jgi:hypothetical protein
MDRCTPWCRQRRIGDRAEHHERWGTRRHLSRGRGERSHPGEEAEVVRLRGQGLAKARRAVSPPAW